MVRVHVVVEGQTEETFVKRMLAPYLGFHQVFVDARSVETSRHRLKIYRGGVLDYGRVKRDLERWMKEDDHEDCLFTTMIDLYHLPDDFPGYRDASREADPYTRVMRLEEAFHRDLGHPRFIPYLQLHEFEALLLSNPAALELEFSEHQPAIQNLSRLVETFDSPELIDDGPESAPSKRIIKEIPDYLGRKVSAGPPTLERIGFPTICAKCPHFDGWLRRLESLGEEV